MLFAAMLFAAMLFAAMQVPEIWRHDGKLLQVFRLNEGRYIEVTKSIALADFPVQTAQALLARRLTTGETSLVAQFFAACWKENRAFMLLARSS